MSVSTFTFINSLNTPFVRITAASFLQGAVTFDSLARENEKPAHLVDVESYYISVYPITQEEYRSVMHINPSYFSACGKGKEYVSNMETNQFPVESVSWDDAMEYCKRLSAFPSEKESKRCYRLPTESEWEYACRAGQETVFAGGNSLTSYDANIDGHYPYNSEIIGDTLYRPCPVGAYKPNKFGLYDMHGNVWEWCQDIYKPYNSDIAPNDDARVMRGGSWNCYSRFCRASYRCIANRHSHFYDCGFRIVCEVTQNV